jgi:hypothetical protein
VAQAKRALEQNPARLKAWQEDECPRIFARAKTEDAEIYWGDETDIRQYSNWVRGYSVAGLTPAFGYRPAAMDRRR